MARNDHDMQHLFGDCQRESFQPGSRQFCYLHGAVCDLPKARTLSLYVAGFACKGNSQMNQDRYKIDPTASHHFESFTSCVRLVENFQPSMVLLENVTGICKTRGKDGCGTVLESIMKHLNSLKGYIWRHWSMDTFVLPTIRPRVYFFGARLGEEKLQTVSSRLENLLGYVEGMPRHHLAKFLLKQPSLSPYYERRGDETVSEQKKAEQHAAYAAALAKARKRASERSAGNLPESEALPALLQSESMHCPSATAWMKSQIDVYDAITRKMLAETAVQSHVAHRIADAA